MGWRQMVVGAVVGQVAEFLRERKQNARPETTTARPGEPGVSDEVIDRAPGGRLNPLNAAEDMLKRVVDHAQYRTDQSVLKATEELLRKTEEKLPGVVSDIEAAGDRITERMSERLSTILAQNVVTLEELVKRQRAEAELQVKRMLWIALGGLAAVGAGLILLAWALLG